MDESCSGDVAKLDALLDRAMHAATPEQEARTCAWIAIMHMRKLGLRPANQKRIHELENQMAELKWSSMATKGELKRTQDRVRDLEEQEILLSDELRRARAELSAARPTERRSDQPPLQSTPGKGMARWITSRYEGYCQKCGAYFSPGSLILWRKFVKGSLCQRCGAGSG